MYNVKQIKCSGNGPIYNICFCSYPYTDSKIRKRAIDLVRVVFIIKSKVLNLFLDSLK